MAPFTMALALPLNLLPLANPLHTPVLVTGGTGFVGSYLIKYLLAAGYTHIRATKRPNSMMDLIGPHHAQHIQWVEADLLDPFSLQDALQGIELVYHCAGLISYHPKAKKQLLQVNVQGAANLINEALEANIRKLVFTSDATAIGYPSEHFLADEHTPWEWKKERSTYALSKHLAELEAWRGLAEGLNVAIVNPAVILGAGNWLSESLKIFNLAWHNAPFYPPGENGFVDVRDVAQFMIRLMESPVSGERFILTAENMTIGSLMQHIAAALDKKGPRTIAPPWLIHTSKILDHVLPLGLSDKLSYHNSASLRYNNAKSIQDLNWSYRPLHQTITETAQHFAQTAHHKNTVITFPV
jgi:dihydroflavonol-4-reductase